MPKILFIPVSSETGVGEYQRSLNIAESLRAKFSHWEISFVINRHAPYASNCPFPCILVDKSPTKVKRELNKIIKAVSPDIVVFDASGRAGNFRVAKETGAKVIFISQHAKKTARGLKANRIRYIDKHIVVQPTFMRKPFTYFEQVKLRLNPLAIPTYVGTLYQQPDDSELAREFAFERTKANLLVVSAGSGSHYLDDGRLASDVYYDLALHGAMQQGLDVVFVSGVSCPKEYPSVAGVRVVKSLSNRAFLALLSQANFATLSGGSTLLQAIELGIPTLTSPVSKDQSARISACENESLCISASSNEQSLIAGLDTLLKRPHQIIDSLSRYSEQKDESLGMNYVLSMFVELMNLKQEACKNA